MSLLLSAITAFSLRVLGIPKQRTQFSVLVPP
jgi:hypothetical protein